MFRTLTVTYKVYASVAQLPEAERTILQAAIDALPSAYAPYSQFYVAAAIQLDHGAIVTGTNQENAAFPAGICAEGVALAVASSLYPGVGVSKIAVTARSDKHTIDHPITPCGICRQKLMECQMRFGKEIEIILAGESGECFVISSVDDLLPLSFSASELKGSPQ